MTTTAYQAILADLASDLQESEAEERELRRLERYLLRKLEGAGTDNEPTCNGAPASRRGREQHLDLLETVRHDLASVERVLDELRLLDTRVRRLAVRPSGNGASAAGGSAVEVLQVELDESVAAGDSHTDEPSPDPPVETAGETERTTVRMRPPEAEPTEATAPTKSAPVSTPAASQPAGSAGLTQLLLEKSAGLRIVSRGDFGSGPPDHSEPVDVTVFTAPEAVAGATASLFVLCRGAGSRGDEPPAVDAPGRSGHSRGSFGTMLSCDGRLSFELSVASVPIRMPRREIVWTGSPNVAEFRIPIPAETRADSVIGKLTVVQNTVPIGRSAFQWRLVEEGGGEEVAPSGQALRFERVYLSHAPQDRPEVQRRVSLLKSAGIRPVEGNLDLDASQRWARGLYRQIDSCDALLLFWSPAAADSAWIQKEWQYGVKRHGADFILPVVLDGDLPPQLSGLRAPGAEPYLHLARR